MIKKIFIMIILLIVIIGLIVNVSTFSKTFSYQTGDIINNINSEITVNNPSVIKQDMKILVIEINPILKTIEDTKLYSNNNGHPYVSEFLGQDKEASLNEMIEDLEDMSHGYLNISIQKEFLDEFPTYTKKINLKNGQKAFKFDEETYLDRIKYDGSKKGNWWNLWHDNVLNDVSAYTYDYNYIIDKYDLIKRRNNHEFDAVWLLTIDPASTYETIMIGNNPFWINAPGYKADCPNFQMANISISRRDANLHAVGHGVEGILNAAFHKNSVTYSDYTNTSTYNYYTTSYSSYEKNSVNVSSINDYSNLTYWEKFMLNDYSNNSNYSSVGNVHFPFNATKDYDYNNHNKVYSNWKEWLNYPNINGDFQLDNDDAWLNHEINKQLSNNENKDPDRLYMRFWFYLMPHITGYTSDGYSNNWWKYFYSLDYVQEIRDNKSTNIETKLNSKIIIDCDLVYNSNKIDKLTYIPEGDNIQISNNQVLDYKNGILYAVGEGISDVTLNYDGKTITYNVSVLKDNNGVSDNSINKNSNSIKNYVAIVLVLLLIIIIYIVYKKRYSQ